MGRRKWQQPLFSRPFSSFSIKSRTDGHCLGWYPGAKLPDQAVRKGKKAYPSAARRSFSRGHAEAGYPARASGAGAITGLICLQVAINPSPFTVVSCFRFCPLDRALPRFSLRFPNSSHFLFACRLAGYRWFAKLRTGLFPSLFLGLSSRHTYHRKVRLASRGLALWIRPPHLHPTCFFFSFFSEAVSPTQSPGFPYLF